MLLRPCGRSYRLEELMPADSSVVDASHKPTPKSPAKETVVVRSLPPALQAEPPTVPPERASVMIQFGES
jgi:hypothetical protein